MLYLIDLVIGVVIGIVVSLGIFFYLFENIYLNDINLKINNLELILKEHCEKLKNDKLKVEAYVNKIFKLRMENNKQI